MRIYLVRSAHAAETARNTLALSNRGRLQALSIADHARTLDVAPARIVVAGAGAARETVKLLAPAFASATPEFESIPADARLLDVLDVFRDHAHEKCLLVVADNPLIGELLHVLCAPGEAGTAAYLIRRGELVSVAARAAHLVGTARLLSRFCMGSVEMVETRARPTRAASIAA